jgi:translocation and assembly module TamB
MIKNALFRWAVVCAFFFALGFTYKYHLPQIESWLLVKVEDLAARKAPLQVVPQKLQLSLFPLGISLYDVKIIPKPGLDKMLAPARLQEIDFGVNLWALIRGDVRLSRVILKNSEVTFFLHLDENKKGPEKKTAFKLEDLQQIPVDEIELENMTLLGRIEPQNLVFKITNLDLDVVNLYNSLYVYFGTPNILMKPSGPYPTLDLEAQGRGLLETGELRISALKIKSHESFLVASGLLNGNVIEGDVATGRFNARTHLDLRNVESWLRVLPHPPAIPKLSGLLDVTSELSYKGSIRNPDLNVAFETKDLQFDKFKLGDLKAKVVGNLKAIHIDDLSIRNEAGSADLKKIDVELKPVLKFGANVEVPQIELKQLLLNLGVKNVPLHLDLQASFPCRGSVDPKFSMICDGDIHGKNLEVRNKSGKKVIVRAKEFSAKGTAKIDQNKVTYQADARMGAKSKGHSNGVIDYDQGFQIQYEGDHLDFGDIENLVDLKFEGEGQVKGSTEGDSDRATLALEIQTKNLWFEDFGIGTLKSNVSYKTGHLFLKNIEGSYNTSRYNADLDVNLLDDQLTAQAKLPFADLKDLRDSLQRRLPIPVSVSGTGTGTVTAHGPLNITKINYQVQSQFFRGKIAGEDFDVLRFDVDGVDGTAHTKRVNLTKSNGSLEMRGLLKPEWTVDSVLVGHGLRLEQSEFINSLGLDIQGQTDFNFVLRGPLKTPHMELNGRLSKVIIADIPQDDSSFRMDFSASMLAGSGNFLGNKVITQFVLPLEPNAPFAFDLKTTNWDFTNSFALISRSSRQMDFQTSLTMEAKLRADEGGFWKSTGAIDVKDLHILHGAQSMASQGPMRLSFKQGVINSSDNFGIASGDNYLKLHVANFTRDHLSADLNGKMDLSLLSLIAPFIADLRGNLSLNVDLKGTFDKPLLSGSTFIDKAYVKLRDFVHPFSNVRADLLFNQQTLLVNAFRCDLGGGRVTGDGKIAFVARDNVPVDVKASLTDVSLNVPEGYKTRGSGTVAIHGQAFPYTMSIQYDVQSGEVTSEFGGATVNGAEIKASPYLPKFVTQDTFEPFLFDVDAVLKKPVMVSNLLVHSLVNGQVKAKGTPNKLLLDGGFSLVPGGKVFFRDVPFDVTTGYIEYADYPPENPRIYVTATTRVSEIVQDQQHMADTVTQNGQTQSRQVENQYDVALLVQGRAQPIPLITLTSTPPLSQRDIVSLLALGMTPDALDEKKSGSQQAANTAIGAAILQQPVGKKLKESLGVDMKVSSTQMNSINAQDTAGPTVTLSKQWTPKFSASASSSLGASPTNGVKLEYKVNNAVSVVGSWEDKDTTVLQDTKDVPSDIFGLDLEYRLQFK